jgi:hypothetical protein
MEDILMEDITNAMQKLDLNAPVFIKKFIDIWYIKTFTVKSKN